MSKFKREIHRKFADIYSCNEKQNLSRNVTMMARKTLAPNLTFYRPQEVRTEKVKTKINKSDSTKLFTHLRTILENVHGMSRYTVYIRHKSLNVS